MRPVFISYEKHDAGIANELCAYLERNGHACWIAPRDIVAGENYAGEIIRGVKGSGALIVVCSGFTKKSGHVLNEVSIAFDQKIQIIPYCVEDTHLGDNMDYYLAAIHRIISAGDRDADFKTILDTLENGRSVFTKKESKKAHNHIGIAAALSAIIIAAAVIFFTSKSGNPAGAEAVVPASLETFQTPEVEKTEVAEPAESQEKQQVIPSAAADIPQASPTNDKTAAPVKEEVIAETSAETTSPAVHEDEETTEQELSVPENKPVSLRETLASAKSLYELEGKAEYYHVTINTSASTLSGSYLLICSQNGDIKSVLSPQDASGSRTDLMTGKQVERIDYSKDDRVEFVKP